MALKGLASLKLTVVLLALSAVLVFIGTLAQVHLGIWTVVHTYFRSFFVWVPLAVFFTPTHNMNRWLGFPYPGGWLLGTVLLVNLLAAHIVRFKISWKRTGILLIHAGLIILMLGELVTGLFAVEGQMPIEIGRATNFVTHTERKELAFVVPGAEPGKDDVVVIPGSRLRQGDGWITSPDLPCDVKVDHYMVNSALLQKPPPPDAPIHATAGAGLQYTPDERAGRRRRRFRREGGHGLGLYHAQEEGRRRDAGRLSGVGGAERSARGDRRQKVPAFSPR